MKAPRGFTLIELMIVVAIIGILSMLSITGYKSVVSKSRLAEGHNVISGVKIAQDQYFAETGRYADIGWTNFCPQPPSWESAKTSIPYGWDPACNGGTATWARLAYSPDGATRFGVKTTTVAAGTVVHPAIPNSSTPANSINGVAMVAPAATPKPWYAIAAVSNLNDDATDWTTLYTTSLNAQIWVDSEGN